MSVDRYLGLVEAGVLAEDDRVELLEGVVVAMTPSSPRHAAVVNLVGEALREAVGRRAAVRVQCPLVLAPYSAPEPDVAVVAGSHRDHLSAHPTSALLVVEVSEASLQQDRITKAAIYAAAGIPEFWIVNLREGVVEAQRAPAPERALYREARTVHSGERLDLVGLPGAAVAVADLLPGSP
jgi:Uma2 family endonuclease